MAKYLFTVDGKDPHNIKDYSDYCLIDKNNTKHFDPAMGTLYPFGYKNEEMEECLNFSFPSTRAVRGFTHDIVEEIGDFLCKDNDFVAYAYSVSGTDGVEYAIQLASKCSTKNKIVSFTPTWHGSSYVTKSLSSNNFVSKPNPNSINIHSDYDDEDKVLMQVEEAFKDDVFAVITTPINSFFMKMWSDSFYNSLRMLCDKYDVIHINDDVLSCWGKHGTYHGFQYTDSCKPDISVLGKAMGGGYATISAIVCNDKILNQSGGQFTSSHSYLSDIKSLHMVKKTIEIIERDNLMQNAKTFEQKMDTFLDKLLKDGRIPNYYVHGLMGGVPIENYQTPGLSNTVQSMIRYTIPINSTEEYFDLLKEKILEEV